ncbi:MAG: protein kinase domain-containing protein [Gemmataceae bacterium]
MSDEERALQLCHAVWELPAGEEAEYLDRECAGKARLRKRVEALLAEHQPPPSNPDDDPTKTPSSSGPLKVGEMFAGRFKLREKLGEGGMGVVFVADQLEPVRRRVALKVIKAGADSARVLARFEQERQALALMDHPNIAKVFDAGVDTGSGAEASHSEESEARPYFVMELIKGVPLTKYCDEAKLTPRQRLELFIPVCHAVQHAHQKGIIHRDLKPSNILVGLYDGAPVPKVIDFGVAKATGPQLTTHSVYTEIGSIIGTFEYMSPEQAELNNLDIDTRSDIYSLGVILYELLTGSVPFSRKELQAAGFLEMLRLIKEREPPKPSTRLSKSGELPYVASVRQMDPIKLSRLLRGDLDWITMKALDKDRTRRYETAIGLASDLQRFLIDQPVLAGPPGAGYRLRKFVRRNKSAVLAGAIVAVTLIISVIVSTVGFALAQRNAVKAADATNQANAAAADAAEQARKATAEAERARTAQDQAEFQAYIANLTAADISFSANDTARVRLRLDACPEGQRNWEWRYYNSRADESLTLMKGHGAAVLCAVFGPNGEQVLTGSSDKTVRLWDSTNGRELEAFPLGSRGTYVAFSSDGRRFLAVDGPVVRVWDARARQDPPTILRGHLAQIRVAGFSPNGNHIVTTSDDKTAAIWDVSTGERIALCRGHQDIIWSADFDRNGDRLLTASEDTTARVWNAKTGEQVLVVHAEAGVVRSAEFSPSGEQFLTATPGSPIRTWDGRTGKPLVTLKGPNSTAAIARFNPSGDRVLTINFDNIARVWNTQTGELVSELRGHNDLIGCACFSPQGDRVVTTSLDKSVRLWDPATGTELDTVRGHEGAAVAAKFNAAGDRLVTASEDKTARVWDAIPNPDVNVLRGHGIQVRSAAFGPNGNRIVTASWDGSARCWDANSGRELALFRANELGMQSAAFSPYGDRVVTASADRTARVWDALTGEELVVLRGHQLTVWSAAYSPNGDRIVTASGDQTARQWEARTGREVMALKGHTAQVNTAVYFPDGQRILTASNDKTARIWDASNGQELTSLTGHDGGVSSAVLSPAGDRAVTTSWDKTARVWDLKTGKTIFVLQGHDGPVDCAAFHPNGDRIATVSFDRTIRIWDARTGREVAVLRGHDGAIRSVAFSPRGNRMVTASGDRTARVWDARSYRDRFPEIAKWRAAEKLMQDRISSRLRLGEASEQLTHSLVRDSSLDEIQRRTGLAIVNQERTKQFAEINRRNQRAAKLNVDVWTMVAHTSAPPEIVAKALSQAREAAELAPDNFNIANTLGVALFRAGQFEDAVVALTRSDQLSAAAGLGPLSENWAFLAMAQFKSGRVEESRRSLARLRDLVKQPGGDTLTLREVEALIEGKVIEDSTVSANEIPHPK